MKVVLKFHNSTDASVERWWRSLSHSATIRNQLMKILIEEMQLQFEKHQGFPPGCVRDNSGENPCYWWRFTKTVKLKFTVHEHPRHPTNVWDIIGWMKRIVKRRTLKVLITDLLVS